ncbi:hypothetical protein CLAFUW4_12724 [Fulvia fulva]|uniref:Uncharacterized protein n=1 Tax=Passalora fulva TaxID=5499 RepID=A0A9Q8PJD3_PASFU|nr:uncharacterized protein CLAFUR5_12590 [Fulvia fulva]KAK4611765.1 hypothetical protein CLAFUR4_12728 [Fulvia fulva]KAK4612901.1 hypothetical protein CLAFUR0_12735 [Fulvia fulva]UJO23464.1 hypothetical protein CLAFUR5_12590 [Fulvia fulva]WPV21594.1 hypothetical protein CLAFUW4_12724 [Fulvia fulva]WPV36520.1 hypothetical protein CLAFUW7_12731 [Fulvia fulva]
METANDTRSNQDEGYTNTGSPSRPAKPYSLTNSTARSMIPPQPEPTPTRELDILAESASPDREQPRETSGDASVFSFRMPCLTAARFARDTNATPASTYTQATDLSNQTSEQRSTVLKRSRRLSDGAKVRELASIQQQQKALDAEEVLLQVEREAFEVECALSGATWALLQREMFGGKLKSHRPSRPKKLAVYTRVPAQQTLSALSHWMPMNASLGGRRTKARYLFDAEGSASMVFHMFTRMPPELREFVYELAIPAGHVSLRSTGHHRFEKVVIPAWTNLAFVSRHMYLEAKRFIFERHTFILNVNMGTTENNSINTYQLPAHAEPWIRHLVLVVDCTRAPSRAHLAEADWRFLQRMTRLKSIRVCLLHLRKSHLRPTQDRRLICSEVVRNVMMRVPAGCEIVFGARGQGVRDHVEDMKTKCAKRQETDPVSWVPAHLGRVTDVSRAELKAAKAQFESDITLEKGRMHGYANDFRHRDRYLRGWAELPFAEGF